MKIKINKNHYEPELKLTKSKPITKQNTTADVKPGDEYKNVKKLSMQKELFYNFCIW